MSRAWMLSRIESEGVARIEAPMALSEAADATRYYARTGKWPHAVSSRAWAAIRVLPLTELAAWREKR